MPQIPQGINNTKFNVCTAIRDLLLNDDDVKGFVNNRIFPVISPEGIEGSFILYQRDSYSIKKSKMYIYEQQCTVFITCVSSNYDESNQIADAVFKALQGLYSYKDESTGIVINSIELEDSTEDAVADKFIQVLQFSIK